MSRRNYRQFCGLARALDVVGERWTLLIVRNLLLGPRRYGELHAQLPGITTNLLAERLQQLAAAGLVENRDHEGTPRWSLTEIGLALEPAVMELARWGGRYMDKPKRNDSVNIAWMLLSLKRRFRGGFDRRVLRIRVAARSGMREFEISAHERYLEVLERSARRPDATVEGAEETWRSLLFGAADARALLRSGQLQVLQGDASVFRAWLDTLAPVPLPAPTAGTSA